MPDPDRQSPNPPTPLADPPTKKGGGAFAYQPWLVLGRTTPGHASGKLRIVLESARAGHGRPGYASRQACRKATDHLLFDEQITK